MNAERIVELADQLVAANGRYELSSLLEIFRNALENLTSDPAHDGNQKQAARSLENLRQGFSRFTETLTPARAEAIAEIGGGPYFSMALVDGLAATLAASGTTPAVARDRAHQVQGERDAFLQRLEEVRTSLRALNVRDEPLQPGTAQLGLQLPRNLFNNSLKGLGEEFLTLNRVMAVFSEIATGAVEPVEVKQISTSDPLIFLGYDVRTLALVAVAIGWAIDQIKKGLEIRNLVAGAKKAEFPPAVQEAMAQHAEEVVRAAIASQASEMIAGRVSDQGRAAELENGLSWALTQLLGRIERGMTAEIRLLPPASPPTDAPPPADAEVVGEAIRQLEGASKRLEFPRIGGEPLVQLPGPQPGPPPPGP